VKKVLYILCLVCPFFCTGQIINIEDIRTESPDSARWYEIADLSAGLISNGSQILLIKGNVQMEFQKDNKSFLSLSQFNFVKAGEQNFVNEGAQHLRYVVDASTLYSQEFFTQIQYNERTLIKVRALVGTGGRFRLLNKEKQKLFFGLAYMFEYNEENEARNVFRDHRISTYLSFALTPAPHVRLTGTTYFQPIINNPSVFRVTSKTTLVLDITKRLAFTSAFAISFDERKRENVPKTIYNWTNGVRLRI